MEHLELWKSEIDIFPSISFNISWLWTLPNSGGPNSMVFSMGVLIKPRCLAPRALEAKIKTKCAVELLELWGPEIDAFLLEVLTEMDRRASRALEVRNRYVS